MECLKEPNLSNISGFKILLNENKNKPNQMSL